MRFFLSLQSVKGKDALAALFNEYLKGLHTQAIVSEPTYYTVAESHQHTRTAPKTNEAHCYHSCAMRYYELTILVNSLESIHSHVLAAISLLEGFQAKYGDDLLSYARDNRRHCINEYGSDDAEDWYRDNEADESEKWKITDTTDPERLKHHTLKAELGRFIGGEITETRGEYIGTSGPNDFTMHTLLVAQQSEFSFRKMAEGMWGATLVRVQQDGTTAPIPLADHIEDEMNVDIKAASVTTRFNLVLGFCQVIRERYLALNPDYLIGYTVLLDCLRKVRDVEFPQSLFDELLNLPN